MEQIREHIVDDVNELYGEKRFRELKELLSAMEPADIAEILSDKAASERALLFRILPKDTAIEVFEFLEGQEREELLHSFTDTETAAIIEEMSDDDRTALFEELPAKTVKKLLAHLSPEERRLANTLMNYPEESAGRVMTPEFIDLKESMTAEEALIRIRRTAAKKETIYTTFVVSPDRKLKGTLHLEDLILASPETPVQELMDDQPVFVETSTDQEDAAQTMSKYDLQSLPVVDLEKRLVGILTFDDILDIVEEEATEDFERMAGIQPLEDDYLDTSIVSVVRKRLPWLLVCIVTQFFSSSILEHYTFALESVVALAFFIPMLIDTGGNTGTQASTLVIRGLTVGTIQVKNIARVLGREAVAGFMLGIVLATFGALRAWFMGTGVGVVFVVGVSVTAVVVTGSVIGALLPFVAEKIKIDPAVMSGPFITTVVDVLGLLLYFEVARLVLSLG